MAARPLIRILVLGLLGLAFHTTARADVPSPENTSAPSRIVLGGLGSDGHPDPCGQFCLTVRDASGQPIAGSLVIVDFTDARGLRMPAEQSDAFAYRRCGPAMFGKVTAADGTVCFRLAGKLGDGWEAIARANIVADGVVIASPHVGTLDLDSGDGVSAADLAKWLQLFFSSNCGLADLDGSGDLGAGDLSSWLEIYFRRGTAHSVQDPNCNF